MTYDFSISPQDFDVSLLPPEARTVGSPEFGEAVHSYLTREFEGFGGTAKIVVSSDVIHVTWSADSSNADPLRGAIEKLSRGHSPQAIQLLELLRSRYPTNPDILHALGIALLRSARTAEAEDALQGLVKISPLNQDAWFGLAEAVFVQDRPEDADELYRKAIDIDANSKLAEIARGRLSEIAQKIFRSKMPGAERMDAVMYLVGAIEKFGGMSRQELQKIGIEIAQLGTEGFDVNDSREKYQVRSLSGRFSGLHMVCLMYVAFKILNPAAEIGFDLAKEYAVAEQMARDKNRSSL